MGLRNFNRSVGGRNKWFGRGRNRKGRFSNPAGPGGVCVCVNPNCRNEVSHSRGIPCYQMSCPKCGSPMIRKDGR